MLPRAVCFATSRPANHVICSFIDSSGYASGLIRRCLFIDYIIILFTWSFLVRFDFCSVFIGYNIGCKLMFDVDVTTCVALFLTNILLLKPYVKKTQSKNCQESIVLLQFYSILQLKYKSYQSLVKKYDIFSL